MMSGPNNASKGQFLETSGNVKVYRGHVGP